MKRPEKDQLPADPDRIVHSPSGWSYRGTQENGDQVDCYECGNALNDDQPIVNDDEGYAYHERCHGDPERQYDVSVHNSFFAPNPKDAVDQMVAWLQESAHSAGYRVEGDDGTNLLIDAEDGATFDRSTEEAPSHYTVSFHYEGGKWHLFVGSGQESEPWGTEFDNLDDLLEALLDYVAEGDDLERYGRADLCKTCRPSEHQTCSLDPTCSCCQGTIQQMADEG